MLHDVLPSQSNKRKRSTRGRPGPSPTEFRGWPYFAGAAGWPSAPGAEPPMNTLRPSRYSTNTPTPLDSPLFAWYPNSLISVPIGRLVFVMPFLSRFVGGPPSIPQFVTVPSAPLTSIQIQEWGFTSSTLVTDPCRLIGLFSSKAAANE